MPKNGNFSAARKAKNDEFYTLGSDVEAELSYYSGYFKDKIVYCNCDDPDQSEFWKFFVRVFKQWGLRKLVATCHRPDRQNYSYSVEAASDVNSTIVKTPLPGDGDFRSEACVDILKEADIVVTNPPFSLFREYIAQLTRYGKKFLVIGNMNAITCKEIFPLFMDNEIWLGHNHPKKFRQPNGDMKFFGNIVWFTNLDIKKRHVPLDLRGNKYYGNETAYPLYDNYNAIECGRVGNIPGDYLGYIGVPITFLDKHCPEQFEIVGIACGNSWANYPDLLKSLGFRPDIKYGGGLGNGVINGKARYARILIRKK